MRPEPGPVGARVRVPASTANLGPGFDALGLALALHDDVEVTVVGGGLRVEVDGEGAGQVPRDERHLVVRALRAACDHLGIAPPGLVVRCRNRVPHSRGLGSSASAVVAGVLAGYGLAGREPDDAALDLASRFEGHADNAGASLLGGLVVAWCEQGSFRARRLEPHTALQPVLLVPASTSSTAATRGLLPPHVPHTDAAFTAGRAALAVHALVSAPELLLAATDDRLHQPYRASSYPATSTLVTALRAHGVAAAVSGAGPAVLALTVGGCLPDAVDTSGFRVRAIPVDRTGGTVEPVGRGERL